MTLVRTVFGIIFLRQSPERLPSTPANIRLALAVAVAAALVSHLVFLELTIPFALLRIVAVLGVFAIAVRYLYRDTSRRHRILKMLVAAFLISTVGDLMLIALGVLPSRAPFTGVKNSSALAAYGIQALGAINCLTFAMRISWRAALWYVLGFIAVVLVFYQATAAVLAAALSVTAG